MLADPVPTGPLLLPADVVERRVLAPRGHGDTFDLPVQAELLASSAIYTNQAFRVGQNILALQFHVEVAADDMEKWLIGHTCELRKAGLNIPHLRAENEKYAANLELKSPLVLEHFIKHLNV